MLHPWRRHVLSYCAALLLGATHAGAVTAKLGTTAGLMQQPTSHYYLAVYGAKVDVARDDDKAILRASYVERPQFKAAGYIDQESGYFVQIGSKVTKHAKNHGLAAYFGGGRMQGYVKTDPDAETVRADGVNRRSFSLPGITTSLEYSLRWHAIEIAANHQTFVGYVDDEQLKAYVAWPYNFFQVSLGYTW